VREGRREFLAQFPSYATPEAMALVPDPCDPATFEASKLDLGERDRHREILRLHADLIRLRRTDAVIALQARDRIEGAVLGERAFVLRYAGGAAGDRLLVVNLGVDLELEPVPEPLLAPLPGAPWALAWSSDHPAYGGPGVVSPCRDTGWRIPATSATLLSAEPVAQGPPVDLP
jgi:maltooligosyltrehalose trehalohydrolase